MLMLLSFVVMTYSGVGQVLHWQGWQSVKGNGTTDAGLGVCHSDGGICLFAKGINDHGIYVNIDRSWAGNPGWSGWALIPELKTNAALSAVPFLSNVYVFAKGEDNHIYFNFSPANAEGTLSWHGWQEVPDGGTTDVAVNVSSTGSYIYLFSKGINDKKVYYNRYSSFSRTWEGAKLIEGTFTTNAAVASHDGPANLKLWVFAKGENNEIYFNILNDSNGLSWLGWSHLPSGGTTDKALAVTGDPETLYLFSIGINDRRIYYNIFAQRNGTLYDWSGWNPMEDGGTTDENVAVGGDSVTKIVVYSKGINDKHVYYNIQK